MKGIRVVLEAIKQIGRKDFQYVVGGKGRQRRELEEFCRRNGLSNVRFIGEVADEDVPYYLAAADLFVYPELGQPAFGLVAIEAMLQGTPVLASRAGAIPEIVTKEVGFLFKRGDAQSLAQELDRLLKSPQSLKEASAKCREHVLQNFSYDRMIDETIEVYNEIHAS
jgi:glycosyltransferase involved in cell wall biosynthesis